MFLLKKPDLEKLGHETGFIQNSLEKVLRLVELLTQLARHPFLKNGLISRASIFDLFAVDFDRITANDLRRHLLPLLAKGKLPERAAMVGAVEKFLKPFVMLTAPESEAIKAFYSGGALVAEIIFPDADMQNKIKIAPSLLWKIQNIQSHRT